MQREHTMDHNPFYMGDPLHELREQMEKLQRLASMPAFNEILAQTKPLTLRQITEMVSPHEQLLRSVQNNAEELVKHLDIRWYIAACDPMKQIREMLDSQMRALRPPPLPDEFRDESEEDNEEEW